MKSLLACFAILLVEATPVIAGPVDTPLPANPCLGAAPFQIALVANEVGTDFPGPLCPAPGSGCAETMVVCHHAGKTGAGTIDVAVELFSSTGALIAGPLATSCGLAAGGTAPFVTIGIPLPPPYIGIPIPAGPQVPLGSLRVLSTSAKSVVCDVTLVSTLAPALGLTPGPVGTKDVTVTATTKGQKGD